MSYRQVLTCDMCGTDCEHDTPKYREIGVHVCEPCGNLPSFTLLDLLLERQMKERLDAQMRYQTAAQMPSPITGGSLR